jgi:Mn-dependent DtxR family transcriptional regulator
MESILPKLDSPFTTSTKKYLELIRNLQSAETSVMTISDLEKLLSGKFSALMRQLMEEHLLVRGYGDIWKSIVGSDGIELRSKQLRLRRLMTVFGSFQ